MVGCRSRGISLASTIFIAALAFTIAATIAASCLTHLTLSTSQSKRNVAEMLATRAAYKALDQCAGDINYSGAENITLEDYPDGYGLFAFAPNVRGGHRRVASNGPPWYVEASWKSKPRPPFCLLESRWAPPLA